MVHEMVERWLKSSFKKKTHQQQRKCDAKCHISDMLFQQRQLKRMRK